MIKQDATKIYLPRESKEKIRRMERDMKAQNPQAIPITVTKIDEDDNLDQKLYRGVFNDFTVILFHADDEIIELLMTEEDAKIFAGMTTDEKFVMIAEIMIGFENFLETPRSVLTEGISVDIVRTYKTTDGSLYEDKESALHHERRTKVKKAIARFVDDHFYNGLSNSDLRDLLWDYEEDLMCIFNIGRMP